MEKEQPNVYEYGSTEPIGGIKVISIIGQVEGHTLVPPQTKATKYEHLIPMLTEAEQSGDIKGVLLLLNTMGGDVEAGLAIAELISSMSKPSVSLVLGGGHSIGVALAAAASHSFIAPSASMTIHPVRTSGQFITVPENYLYYIKMQERVIRFVAAHSRISEQAFTDLMRNKDQLADDTGTVLIGEEAVEAGIIDEIGGISDALAFLNNK